MVGPLCYHELLLGSRRSRDHFFRWVYGGWLILQLFWLAFFDLFAWQFGVVSQPYTFFVCRHFAEVFLPQHFILLALVTPAFVASAVTEEKTRGTLQYLLTTDLAPIHIITGKLFGRVIQVCTLSLTGLPLFALLGALGGIEPGLLLGMLIVTVFVAAGVASATFLTAVWSRHTFDAVVLLYVVGFLFAAAILLVGGPLSYFNPAALLAPVLGVGGFEGLRVLVRQLFLGLLAWGGLTLACLTLAAWRLRPAYLRQLEGEGRSKPRRWWGGLRPVGDQPIRWKEQFVEGLAPVPWLRRVPRWLGVALTVAATVTGSCAILYLSRSRSVTWDEMLGLVLRLRLLELARTIDWHAAEQGFLVQGTLALNVFGLLAAIRCSSSVTGERERQTWEALLLTPLSVEELIRGKLWGILSVCGLYLAAYAVPALLLALLGGPAAVIWVVINLGETLLAMYYLGAVGMWASARSRTSWRSLLITVLVAYAAAIGVYICLMPVVLLISGIIYAALKIAAAYLGEGGVLGSFATFSGVLLIAAYIGLVALFWFLARLFLRAAERWVAERERTRHWQNEPLRASRGLRRRRSIIRGHW
jgi:ABC-type transport system involved in multi-copper enzyme maturation permease subunit